MHLLTLVTQAVRWLTPKATWWASTAPFTRVAADQWGLVFAIPATLARQVMDQIVAGGDVTRGWIGIEAQDLSPELAESFKLPSANGALVAGVIPDSPASKAGLHAGDVLLSIEDKQITDTASMLNIIAALPPNKNATVKIFRNEAEKSCGGNDRQTA